MKNTKANNVWDLLQANVADKNSYRVGLKNVYYDHEKGQFVATQGYSLGIVPLRMERFTKSGYVAGDSLYSCAMMDSSESFPDYNQVIPTSLQKGVSVFLPKWVGKMKPKDGCYINFTAITDEDPNKSAQYELSVDCSDKKRCAFKCNVGYLAPFAGEYVNFLYSGCPEKPSVFEVEVHEARVPHRIQMLIMPIRQDVRKS